jgi:hypothetical protein
MQRLGGGGYTRKTKRGGGNDPTCGCDMQAGWPKFLTENIPLPSVGPSQPTVGQKGGGTCGAPPIPNYYQGGGGCAACSGLPLPTPLQQGGGQPTYYNSNPVPDACPFPGTGYCEFYARGGANNNMSVEEEFRQYMQKIRNIKRYAAQPPQADDIKEVNLPMTNLPNDYNSGLGRQLKNKQEFARFLATYGTPKSKYTRRKELNDVYKAGHKLIKDGVKNVDEEKALTWLREQEEKAAAQEGGANYGEPMYLQARLRGGGCGCNARRGGYRPTKKNLAALKKWRKGQSIGFTMTSSLKAKGLIPRTSRKHKGKKVVSAKYK